MQTKLNAISSLKRVWRFLAWTKYKFHVPNRALPSITLRALRPEDIEPCREIYRLNEPGQFPPGYFDRFCKSLASGHSLFLVAEEKHQVLGFGAVTLHILPRHTIVSLSFGLVHPQAQRRGIGTTLLLARIAVLPKPKRVHWLSMAPVTHAQPFFKQYGFGYVRSFRDTNTGTKFDSFTAWINLRDWQSSRSVLSKSGIVLANELDVPVVPVEVFNAGQQLL